MHTTMDLFEKALSVQRAADWAREFNLTRGALSIAKKQRRLSPVLAGNFAMKLGENPEHWIAVAALEAEPETPLLQRLRTSQPSWRKRCPKNNRRTRQTRVFSSETGRIWFGNTVHSPLNDRRVNIHERRQTM